jgi:shikimate kinase
MKNIVLTGFMGTGKTEVGRELSNLLGWRLIDVDEEIVKAEGMNINEIFSRFGEARFRDIETEAIRRVCAGRNVIISTGGGAVLRQENMDMLREGGVIVNLAATADTIFRRTSGTSDRPLLRVENPLEKIRELLELRRPFYEKADITIVTESGTPREIAQEILARTGWKK